MSKFASIVSVIIVCALGLAGYFFWESTSQKNEPSPVTLVAPESEPAKASAATSSTTMTYLPTFNPVTADVDGKSIAYETGDFTPPLQLQQIPEADLTTESPVQAVASYYRFLSQGDIANAAKLSDDPSQTTDTFTSYLNRVGETQFRQKFSENVSVDGVAKIGSVYFVLINTGSYIAPNPVVSVNGTYTLIEDPSVLPQDAQGVLQYLSTSLNSRS